MASPQAQQLKETFREFRDANFANPDATLEQMRANAVGFGELTSEPDGVRSEPVDAGGVPAQWRRKEGEKEERGVRKKKGKRLLIIDYEILYYFKIME